MGVEAEAGVGPGGTVWAREAQGEGPAHGYMLDIWQVYGGYMVGIWFIGVSACSRLMPNAVDYGKEPGPHSVRPSQRIDSDRYGSQRTR